MAQAIAATQTPPRIIKRPRLTKQLDACGARIILLLAPAGYGKTTLAREWLGQGERRYGWYTASRASTDVAAMAIGVATSASTIVPGAGERMRTRLGISQEPSREVDVFAEMLAEDLAEWPDDAWLAIDDYHLAMESDASEEFVERMIALTPIHLLIASRERPRWASARRLLYREHFELSQSDLAMTSDEGAQVLPDARALELAEGWPAVIGLGSFASRSDYSKVANSSALYAYLAEELFQAASERVRRTLRLLAMCPDLPLRIVRKAFGRRAVKALLAEGARLGLVSLTNESTHMHPLIRGFLRAQFVDLDAERSALKTLGSLLIGERRWDDAFLIVEQLEYAELLDEMIEASLAEVFSSGRQSTVERWVSFGEEHRLDSPLLFLAEAELASRRGRQGLAEALAAQAARTLPEGSPIVSKAWYLAGRSAHLADRYVQGREHHRLAEAAAQTPEDLRNALWGQLMTSGQLGSDECLELSKRLERLQEDRIDDRLRLANMAYHVALRVGSFSAIEDQMRAALELSGKAGDPLIQTGFLNTCGRWLVACGRYQEALSVINAAMGAVEAHRLTFALPNALTTRALAHLGARDWTASARALDAAEAYARDFDDIHNQVDSHGIRLRLLMAQGAFDRALEIEGREWDRPGGPLVTAEHLAIRSILFASQGLVDQALGLLQQVQFVSNAEIQPLVEGSRAIVALQCGDDVDGQLTRLIRTTRSRGNVDGLVTIYRAYPRLLDALSRRADFLDELRSVLTFANDKRLAAGIGIEIRKQPAGIGKLSKREREVHELLAQGLSNREIGRLLFIEEVTVKVHVRHIFEKLGVRTRVEAATKALKD